MEKPWQTLAGVAIAEMKKSSDGLQAMPRKTKVKAVEVIIWKPMPFSVVSIESGGLAAHLIMVFTPSLAIFTI